MKKTLIIASFAFAIALHSAVLFIAEKLALPWQLTATVIIVSTIWIFRSCWKAHTPQQRMSKEDMQQLYSMICHCRPCNHYHYHTETIHGMCPICKGPVIESKNLRLHNDTPNSIS